MKTKLLVIALLLAVSAGVNADFRTVARAHEVALSDFRVTPMRNGIVIFRSCADCNAQTVRITPATRFIINNQDVHLRDFRKSIFQVRDRAGTTVVVKHHLETDTVTKVSVWL